MLGWLSAAFCIGIGFWFGSITDHFRSRSYELERQEMSPELGSYTEYEYEDLMRGLYDLNFIDKGGYQATLNMFSKLESDPSSILEIGFGRGDFSMMLGRLYPNSSILGIDAHNFSVTSAQNNLANYRLLHPQDPLSNVKFELCPVNEMPQIENSYDVITTTFVNHHIFPDEEFINFLRYVRRVGKKAFIFNDLYRSVPSYVMSYLFTNLLRNQTAPYLCSFLETVQIVMPLDLVSVALQAARVLSNRPATHLLIESGLKSIEKSFTVTELKEMFKLAGYPESALQCDYFFVPGRVVCYADLE